MPTLRGVIILPPSQPRFLPRLPRWQKGKTKKTKDDTAVPVLYEKLIYSDKTKKIMSLFRSKGNDKVNPFDYLYQYCDRFEPRSHFKRLSLNRTVVVDSD